MEAAPRLDQATIPPVLLENERVVRMVKNAKFFPVGGPIQVLYQLASPSCLYRGGMGRIFACRYGQSRRRGYSLRPGPYCSQTLDAGCGGMPHRRGIQTAINEMQCGRESRFAVASVPCLRDWKGCCTVQNRASWVLGAAMMERISPPIVYRFSYPACYRPV